MGENTTSFPFSFRDFLLQPCPYPAYASLSGGKDAPPLRDPSHREEYIQGSALPITICAPQLCQVKPNIFKRNQETKFRSLVNSQWTVLNREKKTCKHFL